MRAGIVFLDGHSEMASPQRLGSMSKSEFRAGGSIWTRFPSEKLYFKNGELVDIAPYKTAW